MDHILKRVTARLGRFKTPVTAAEFEDQDFKKVLKPKRDGFTLKTREAQTFSVAITPDGNKDFQAMRKKYPEGNLLTDVPNIEVQLAGQKVLLTWNEAYNIGFALQSTAELALYG